MCIEPVYVCFHQKKFPYWLCVQDNNRRTYRINTNNKKKTLNRNKTRKKPKYFRFDSRLIRRFVQHEKNHVRFEKRKKTFREQANIEFRLLERQRRYQDHRRREENKKVIQIQFCGCCLQLKVKCRTHCSTVSQFYLSICLAQYYSDSFFFSFVKPVIQFNIVICDNSYFILHYFIFIFICFSLIHSWFSFHTWTQFHLYLLCDSEL